jgi:hypothetical protein
MKTVKSALLGSKALVDRNQAALLFQLQEIIKEHRALVITRMLSDLPTYLDYKFQVKATKDMISSVHDKLLTLKNSNADLTKYEGVVQQVLNRSVTHLTNEPFYMEIDEYLKPHVSVKQLKFVS